MAEVSRPARAVVAERVASLAWRRVIGMPRDSGRAAAVAFYGSDTRGARGTPRTFSCRCWHGRSGTRRAERMPSRLEIADVTAGVERPGLPMLAAIPQLSPPWVRGEAPSNRAAEFDDPELGRPSADTQRALPIGDRAAAGPCAATPAARSVIG
jgi:hypothetical protein